MEYQFITLLENFNDWLDWVTGRYTEDIETEPKSFPCYVIDECVGFADKDEVDDFKGDACFYPKFLYYKDVQEMLDNLE